MLKSNNNALLHGRISGMQPTKLSNPHQSMDHLCTAISARMLQNMITAALHTCLSSVCPHVQTHALCTSLFRRDICAAVIGSKQKKTMQVFFQGCASQQVLCHKNLSTLNLDGSNPRILDLHNCHTMNKTATERRLASIHCSIPST